MVARKRRRFKLIIPVLVIILLLFILYIVYTYSSHIRDETLPSKKLITSANTTRTPRKTLLLVYNGFFGNKEWITGNEDCAIPRTRAMPCVKDKFEVTHDKQRFYESDFVLVHTASDLPSLRHLKAMRRQKPSSQLWIYCTMESPVSKSNELTRYLNELFDLSFTYRTDSSFWKPYSSYEEIPFVNLSHQDFSAGKGKLVSWIVSNCKPQLRKSFVRELQKHITVDVFGRCSVQFGKSRPCSQGKDCTAVIKQYKFYLAFENALCEDYITEKYWSHLGEENVIPIVMGGANYTKLAIPGSYINVLDFKTVKDLADYLHYLDKNNTAYNEYFTWRQKYQRVWLSDFCSFCEVLSSETPKVLGDLTEFWVTQGKCNEKDLTVLNMWTPSIKYPAYFFILMASSLFLFMMTSFVVYFTLVRKGLLQGEKVNLPDMIFSAQTSAFF